MLDAAHAAAILARIERIPIFDTLRMHQVVLDEGRAMNIRFLARCLSDVQANARVIKRGRLMCPVTVDLLDAAGTLVAVAQVNYLLLDKMPSR